MCGIFAYLAASNVALEDSKIHNSFARLRARGPDHTAYKQVGSVWLGFHRLAINDQSQNGNQPIMHPSDPGCVLICNGEIYNWRQLCKEHGFTPNSGSDCEVILHMYKQFGMEETVRRLDGVFAFVLLDGGRIYIARDPFGVRPLFFGRNDQGDAFAASELKGIADVADVVHTFPPGHLWSTQGFVPYFSYDIHPVPQMSEKDAQHAVRMSLTAAVDKRIMSDRPLGCLLSGGLDSSLITALVARHFPPHTLNTFSIGLKGSPDLFYAQKVADFLQTKHHTVQLTEAEFLAAVERVVYTIESFDVTTVRASVGNYLIGEAIRKNTDCIVIYNGDGSDEVCGSYLYFHNAPNQDAFHHECIRLLKDIHMFDVLRSDRCISGHGLEPRTPFLDKAFVRTYLSTPVALRQRPIEKHLLRASFEGILPQDVLWRQKEAFSDGVSATSRSWSTVLQEHCTSLGFTNEAEWYRHLFDQHYKKHANVIPYAWMPKWSGDVHDPSARVLDVYRHPTLGQE